jgi:hypothetical protein
MLMLKFGRFEFRSENTVHDKVDWLNVIGHFQAFIQLDLVIGVNLKKTIP